MAQVSHAGAYSNRASASTRNPHMAAKAAPSGLQFGHLDTEERILAQWQAAFGCPVSDEAKAQFCITALGRTFNLSDVRLWKQMHPAHSKANKDKIHLEFFFDGAQSELADNVEVFTQAFERMIESQLQERRVVEFRKKLAARRRRGKGAGEPGCDEPDADYLDDGDWQQYLQKPVPKSDFSVRSFREAGCCLTFLVCQTSLSVGASEVLGQIAFQEHFPIDGKAQEPSKSEKPLPRWVYYAGASTCVLSTLALGAWWQVVKQFAFVSGASETALPMVGA